jgi:hypothetical protein
MIYLFCKTTYLNEEVNLTESFPSVKVPWLRAPQQFAELGYQSFR